MQDLLIILDDILIYVSVAIFWLCAILFWIKYRKIEMKSQKRFFLGISSFFILWGIMRLVFTASNYYKGIDEFLFSTYWRIASGIGIAGILSILLVIETYMVKSKYIFSIITLVGLVLAMVLPIEGTEIKGARLATYVTLPVGALSILGLYLYLYIKLSGRSRHETGIITGGIALIFFGYILNIELFKQLFGAEIVDPLASIIMIIGALIYSLMYFRKKD
ncbi:MAG: hypothetical protein ACTSPY_00305 [Candidatus Helarchaeota archaeon]